MLSRFHPIPGCYRRTDGRTDRQTDGRTELLYQYRASLCWRAIETLKICLFVSIEYTNVTGRRTDRRAGGHALRHSPHLRQKHHQKNKPTCGRVSLERWHIQRQSSEERRHRRTTADRTWLATHIHHRRSRRWKYRRSSRQPASFCHCYYQLSIFKLHSFTH